MICMCVFCFEDSFVNSQEWTLSRSVPDLKLVSGAFVALYIACNANVAQAE